MNYGKAISPAWGEKYDSLSDDEKLSYLINLEKSDASLGLYAFYKRAVEWMKNPQVFLCRFEDLVGPNGGGNIHTQKQTIISLSEHLGYQITEDHLQCILDNLFGGTPTFHEGQINSWPKYFNEYNKQLFKEQLADMIVALGYSDDNW
jgi:hypothetical protein